MTNLEVAWVFEEIADLLEIKGENPFKIRAYRQAGRLLYHLEDRVEDLASSGGLSRLPGFGSALVAKTKELLNTGKVVYLEDLRREVPSGLRELLAIPRLGPRGIRAIHEAAGVNSLEDLEKALKERRIRLIPGMGSKTEERLRRGLELMRQDGSRYTLGVAIPVATVFMQVMSSLPEVSQVQAVGSLRRRRDTVGDVDLLVAAEQAAAVMDLLCRHPAVREVEAREPDHLRLRTRLGVPVEVVIVEPEAFANRLLLSTGSKAHLAKLRQLAGRADLSSLGNEEAVYAFLGLDYIPPELREDRGEIEAAREHRLPRLVRKDDIKGDLHSHSRWSDGGHTVREMAEAAQEMGYQYLGVTDHTQSLTVARGLNPQRWREQEEEIDRINVEMNGAFTLLKGTEVDIMKDGSLDLPDKVLGRCQVVVASVHSAFNLSREEQTSRVLRALKNPYVDILAHPTGRLLGKRPGYEIDLDAVLEAAADEGKAVEINACADRLDLDDLSVRRAGEMGIPVCTDTDAHETSGLEEVELGIGQARRGWLTAGHILNSKGREELMDWLQERRRRAGVH